MGARHHPRNLRRKCIYIVFIDDENPVNPSQKELEESLIGLWYEEFPYEDVTESASPIMRYQPSPSSSGLSSG